jgi:purine-binding chemotaxis protein CheW
MSNSISEVSTSEAARKESASVNQYVSFWIGGQLLGVPVSIVQEVLNPQYIARTPRARREIAGLLNLRGQIVTAVSLRRRLQLPDLESEHGPMNVVVRYAGESFSLLVDEVGDVINVSNQSMDPVPATLESTWRGVTNGVYRLEGRLFVVVNVGAILNLAS